MATSSATDAAQVVAKTISGQFIQECVVDNFSDIPVEEPTVRTFDIHQVPEFSGSWQILLDLNADYISSGGTQSSSSQDKWLSICVNRENNDDSTEEFEDLVHVKCQIRLLATNTVAMTFRKEFEKRHGLIGTSFVTMQQLKEFQRQFGSDTVTVIVKVQLTKKVAKGTNSITLPAGKIDNDGLRTDLAELLRTSTKSDLIIVASDDTEVCVHSLILDMRRNRTGTLFAGQSSELDSGKLLQYMNVDVDGATLAAIIQYIYTGTIECSWMTLEKVTVASQKYNMGNLH